MELLRGVPIARNPRLFADSGTSLEVPSEPSVPPVEVPPEPPVPSVGRSVGSRAKFLRRSHSGVVIIRKVSV